MAVYKNNAKYELTAITSGGRIVHRWKRKQSTAVPARTSPEFRTPPTPNEGFPPPEANYAALRAKMGAVSGGSLKDRVQGNVRNLHEKFVSTGERPVFPPTATTVAWEDATAYPSTRGHFKGWVEEHPDLELVAYEREADWQGDQWYVIYNTATGEYAMHTVGFGSCEGCDEWLAAIEDDDHDLTELYGLEPYENWFVDEKAQEHPEINPSDHIPGFPRKLREVAQRHFKNLRFHPREQFATMLAYEVEHPQEEEAIEWYHTEEAYLDFARGEALPAVFAREESS